MPRHGKLLKFYLKVFSEEQRSPENSHLLTQFVQAILSKGSEFDPS